MDKSKQSVLRMECLEKLKEGVQAWNDWRTQNPAVRPDLSSFNIFDRRQNLHGVNFSKTDLSAAMLGVLDLTDADLSQALLSNANLGSCNLAGANLQQCNLHGSNLQATILSDSNLSDAILTDARLVETNFARANLTNSNLANCQLDKVNLRNAKLKGANLEGAKFTETDLHDADLHEANLRNADLTKAKTSGLQLPDADLNGAKLPETLQKLYEKLGSVSEISDSAKKLFLALLAACAYSWLTIGTTRDVDLITNRASSPLPIIQSAIPIVGFYVVAPIILVCVYFYFHFYLQKLWEELAHFRAIFPDGKPLYQRADPWLFNDLVRAHFIRLRQNRPLLSHFQQWLSVLLAWWLVPATLLIFWLRYLPRHDGWSYVLAAMVALSIVCAMRLYRLAKSTLQGREQPGFSGKEAFRSGKTYLSILRAMVPVALLILTSVAILHAPSRWRYHRFQAYLQDADASVKPPNWTGKKDEELDQVKGADLRRQDLRFANANGAFLAKANLGGSDLSGAILQIADLRQADLARAHLNSANLQFTKMQSADLTFANLTGAELGGADLTGANLRFADLTGAKFGPHLKMANMEIVAFAPTLKYTDFQNSMGLTEDVKYSKHWEMAYYDNEMLRRLYLPPDHNESLKAYQDAQSQEPFDDAWIKKWRESKSKPPNKPL